MKITIPIDRTEIIEEVFTEIFLKDDPEPALYCHRQFKKVFDFIPGQGDKLSSVVLSTVNIQDSIPLWFSYEICVGGHYCFAYTSQPDGQTYDPEVDHYTSTMILDEVPDFVRDLIFGKRRRKRKTFKKLWVIWEYE